MPPPGSVPRAAPRPAGRRIAAPEERRPDVRPTDALTETGSHARITEPIASPPPATPVRPPAPRATPEPTPKPAPKPSPKPPRRQSPPAVIGTAAERRAQFAITGSENWFLVLLLGAATVAFARLGPDLPEVVRTLGGVLVSSSLAWGLAVRTGGRPVWATALTTVLGLAAAVTQWESLLSGAAIGTAVLAATFSLMLTTPAATFGLAIREALVAVSLAWVGALGVLGYVDHDDVDVERFGYVVFALSLVAAFALVYRLGAGLHGLGRRGYAVAAGATLLLFLAMAYSEAISQWGSRDLVDTLDQARDWLRSTLGAVPHPIMGLLGYPALVWGVFMRARRRQGWWVCAFGVAATASAATRLIAEDLGVRSIVLGEVYSLLIGLVLGYLVIRVEQSFTGSHGRRARRDEEAVAHRPEPRRTSPLH